ncbi:MAG: copper chaperone PCu(A)C [Azoarcus sp.]|jgi:copper(I)-binding protein|nr:copper chaperone PCu(A)C [Azoarcus sp.]
MKIRLFTLSVVLSLPMHVFAQETIVHDPWVRATVSQQKATGAFMNITAKTDAHLTSVRSPLAEVVEIHQMTMEGEQMKMRAIANLALPAGKPVALQPGGYHLMLIGLNTQLKEGDTVPLTLTVKHTDGHQETLDISAPVLSISSEGPMSHRQ